MPRPAHRPSQQGAILEAVVAEIRSGGMTLSLDSAARSAGVTKSGLMYHFATKEALVAALVDRVMDEQERHLSDLLDGEVATASARARLSAYARWSLTRPHDAIDLVMLGDPRLWDRMVERWSERLAPWLAIPEEIPTEERVRLQAVRMLADGVWFADASGILPVPQRDRAALLDTALRLLEESTR